MKQISSVDLMFLTKELQSLVNQRIETFYFENMIFYMRVYVRGVGHKYLTVNMGKYIYLGDKKDDSSAPNNFIAFLRKYLKPSFIRSIEQIGIERILKIEIEKKVGEDENAENGIKVKKFNLYLELFGNGNVVLTDSNNIIMNSLTKKKFKDRTVMNKEKYELPPMKPLSIIDVDMDVLKSEVDSTDLVIVKFLAIKFGLGGKFAEYICDKAGVDKNLDPRKVDWKKMIKELSSFKDMETEPYLSKDGSDFYSVNFNVPNQRKCESFNACLIEYFSQFKTVIDVREREFDKQVKKLKNRLKKQENTKVRTLNSYEENNLIGTKIFENYSVVDELLVSINKAAKEKGWEYVKNVIKSDERLSKLVKKLDYKKDSIILNLD